MALTPAACSDAKVSEAVSAASSKDREKGMPSSSIGPPMMFAARSHSTVVMVSV